MAKRFETAKKYTEKYKDVLVACRFCKGKDLRITSDRTIFNPRNVWSVDCACGNCVYGLIRVKDAVKRWNETNSCGAQAFVVNDDKERVPLNM